MTWYVLQFHISYTFAITDYLQFTYNPEWFADEDDDTEEEWDIEKFRRETEAEHDAEEVARIAALSLNDGSVNVEATDVGDPAGAKDWLRPDARPD